MRVSGISEPSSSCPVPRGSSERYFSPSRVLIRIDAAVWGPKPDAVVGDPEVDPHVGAVELDAGDVADLHAGDPDVVAVADAAGLGERGAVAVAATDDRQVRGVERQDEEQEDDEDPDDAEAQRVLLLQGPVHDRHLAASTS